MSKNNEKKARRLRITLLDDATHDRLRVWRVTRVGIIWTVVGTVIALFAVSFAIVAFTPLKKLIPGYPDAYSRQAAVRNAIRIDSLENEIVKWDLYTTNLRLVLSGEATLPVDSLLVTFPGGVEGNIDSLKAGDTALRAVVSEADRFDVSGVERKLPVEGLDFFTPVKGEIAEGFDRLSHPFVEVAAPEGTIVMAVLDGTVLYTGFDQNEGYTIVVSHSNELISVNRFCQSVLKKAGDPVKAGAPIATVGGPRPLKDTPCIGLELWYKGERIDPAKYINF